MGKFPVLMMLSQRFLSWKQAQKKVKNCCKKVRKGEKGKAKKKIKLKSLKMKATFSSKNYMYMYMYLKILISLHAQAKDYVIKCNVGASGKKGMLSCCKLCLFE